jgi:catechol 2,3-dioxygenase-like lactoylglutathione lyase family enzyme
MQSAARYGTRDIERAKIFYDGIAQLLGAKRVFERPELVAYKGADGGMFIIGQPLAGEATAGNGTQVGLTAPSRAIVDAVHAKALELGGTCEGAPGVRGTDPNGFYGAYFRDPDGNKFVVSRFGPPD